MGAPSHTREGPELRVWPQRVPRLRVDVVSGCAGQETRGLSGQRGVAGQTLRMASRSQELCNSQG